VDGLAGELGSVLFAHVDELGDEDSGGDVAGVATSFSALAADDVDALFDGLDGVLGGSDLDENERRPRNEGGARTRTDKSSAMKIIDSRKRPKLTMFMTGIPAACSLSIAHLGGTPTAETKSLAPDCSHQIKNQPTK
jgi:hypothetical protein